MRHINRGFFHQLAEEELLSKFGRSASQMLRSLNKLPTETSAKAEEMLREIKNLIIVAIQTVAKLSLS